MRSHKIKFSIFCLVVFAIVCLPLNAPMLSNFASSENYSYTFYVSGEVQNIANANIVKNGSNSIVTCSGDNCRQVKQELNNILGETITLYNSTQSSFDKILCKIADKIKFTETIDNLQICYAYDSTLLNFVMVNGQKINLQIAVNADYIKIGYPLILDSY